MLLLAIVLSFARLGIIVTLALKEYLTTKARQPGNYRPAVTVVIPAFNEEKVIGKTIDAVLRSSYDALTVIIVDDGSSDKTYSNAVTAYGDHPRVQVLRKSNQVSPRH